MRKTETFQKSLDKLCYMAMFKANNIHCSKYYVF